MRTLGDLVAEAQSWVQATGYPARAEWFSFPYLGTPWEHSCERLRSTSSSISVVVPFWNSAASLASCLAAIRLSSLNRLAPQRLEVIVCDDGSTDNSWQIVKSAAVGLCVRAYRLPHRSQPVAIDYAVDRAGGDIVVLCDSDMVLGCGALDELAARHERWANVVCFGFRSDVPSCSPHDDLIWELMHSEAFSCDNRVSFDIPTLEPNMLVATDWLTLLDNGLAVLDSQGSVWPRHRFVYGCLFSAPRSLLRERGLFPEQLHGWGYGDTIVAARMEAAGAFLMPVTAAWGHHLAHALRHPDQWFQGSRNRLAYEYLLAHPPTKRDSRARVHAQPMEMFSSPPSAEGGDPRLAIGSVKAQPITLVRLGWWERYLSLSNSEQNVHLTAECLFRLGREDEIALDAELAQTMWGVLSLHRCGATASAARVLQRLAASDVVCEYAASASIPELKRLADHYVAIGMTKTARNYYDLTSILAASE